MRLRIGSLLATAAVTCATILATAAPTSALALPVRFASPNGTGTSCNVSQPCDILTAVNDASGAGSEVIVKPGTYGSKKHPLSNALADSGGDLNIHGVAGQARPLIYSGAGDGFILNNESILSDVAISYQGAGIALAAGDATVDHVIVVASAAGARACSVEPEISDSLCVATGKGGSAFSVVTGGSATSDSMDNVTAVATGSGGYGINYDGPSGASTLNATNTIARGDKADILVTAGAAAATSVNFTTSVGKNFIESGAAASVNTEPGDVTKAPKFVDAAHLDFREKPSSPTVDTGSTPVNPDTDLQGNPRTLGPKTDIGAYELPEKPSLTSPSVTKRTKHKVSVTATVNDEGLKTHLKVTAKSGRHTTSTNPVTITPTDTAMSYDVTVTGLAKHTRFQLVLTAGNAAGKTTVTTLKAKTH